MVKEFLNRNNVKIFSVGIVAGLLLATTLLASAQTTMSAESKEKIPPLPLTTNKLATADLVRERLSFNENWRFRKDASPTELAGENFDDSRWRLLNLPHDWGIEGPFKQEYPGATGKLPWWGVGWYRKHFTIQSADRGRRVFVDFDGAMSHAEVWLNGKSLGGWPYGYASFRIELTPYLKFDSENVIAVRLDNPEKSSRWYPGGGIYRNVWLVKASPVHVAYCGTFISTSEVSADKATVKLQIRVQNQSGENVQAKVKTEIHEIDAARNVMKDIVASSEETAISIPLGESGLSESIVTISRPQLWRLKDPRLYAAITSVTQDGKLVDQYETQLGIRKIEFTADNGFLLNGERVQLNGVCLHHDLGALGAAVNTRAIERRIELLQKMGCNAIRTSHNPPTPELLDLCDRMGMLVIDEAFDCWKKGKLPHDYSSLFAEWHEKDLRAMIRRDRNHPSVILWSTGNEVREQNIPEDYPISEELRRIAHEEDPTRMTTAGCSFDEAGYNGFQKTLDVFGFNYKPYLYRSFRDTSPTIPVIGSETSSCVSTRGEYVFPVESDKSKGQANFQVSSYDLYAPAWAMPPDWEFDGLDENPFVAGEFVWTGFDYLGEPTPYNADTTNLLNLTDPIERAKMQAELNQLGKISVPSRSSYFGIIDLAGFPKDRFYLYQARWRPELPMAHILPHWNWPERIGKITPVHVYTSGDEAELFLNGKSLGRRKKQPLQYRLRWDDVKYDPGELKVVTWKNGKLWAEQTVCTAGPASQLILTPDRQEILGDGSDLSFVTVTIADANGLTVPRSAQRVHFEIEGPADIIAVDNGDPTSHESFQAMDRKAFNGLCMVIIRTRAAGEGMVTLHANSDGLKSAEVRLTVGECQ